MKRSLVVIQLLLLIVCTWSSVPVAAQQPDTDINKVFEFLRRRNAQDYAITTANGIDEEKYVRIGGIEQWITIRGEDRRNPVLLFLHGGPGDATNPWGYAVFRSWLKYFTVVQWDQRGTGRTFGKNSSTAGTITIDRISRDGIELAEFLRTSLHKEKIVLVGHSLGSILGVFMVKARPDLFSAFIGTGQVANPAKNYDVAYRDLVKKAKTVGNQRAQKELAEVGPPPYSDGRGYAIQRRWSNLFEHADIFLSSMLGLALTAPGYSQRDVNDWLEGQGVSAEALVPETSRLKPETLAGDFAVPVFVIQGAEDFTTPTSLAREFVRTIHAPRKDFVQIVGGGHFAVFIKADDFLRVLVSHGLHRF